MSLLENIKIWKPTGYSTHVASATTFIDMSNWSGCLFLLINGTTYYNSTGTLVITQASAASTGAGSYNSTFSNAVGFGSTNRLMAVDVVKPLKRYLRLRPLTCTGVIVIPITYGGRKVGSTSFLSVVAPTSNQPTGVHLCTT